MSNLVIPATSAGIGFWLGGGQGAAIGWAIGSGYQARKNQPEQDMFQDLRVQTSSYGTTIPLVSGIQRVSGNIIWSTDKTTHQVSQGGKGGGGADTDVTTYHVNLAIAICKGPILGIRRVWEDGKLTADVDGSQNKLPGTLYLGTNVQNPDSVMDAVEGKGNVPAYRGIAYMVLEDFDLGMDGRIPMFSFEVVKGEAL